jgi:predicted nucleic acid-binding Zn ribbon protein
MKKPVHIGSFINEVLFSCRSEIENGIFEIWDIWENLVGEVIATDSKPAVFRKKILIVHVSDSAWIQQLQFLKKDIIKSINDYFGKRMVEDISFRIGPV